MSTLPTFTRVIDQAFTDTFFDIQSEVTDQILLQTPVAAVLKMSGCFKPKVGGKLISRTVGYGVKTAIDLELGDTLTSAQTELDTEAFWTFKKFGVAIQRDTFTDRENQGEDAIKDYVQRQMEAAVDAAGQRFEALLLGAYKALETGKTMQGLNDMIPPGTVSRSTNLYGGIARPTTFANDLPTVGNTWWSPRYLQFVAPVEVNLETNMRALYNSISENTAPPDQIITTKALFEIYEEFASERSQIVMGKDTGLANLGFDELFFKGKSITWSPNMTAGNMLMINTAFIDVVYDPTLWFSMGDWVPEIGTERRQASLLCAGNLISDQLRRHGRLYT